MRPQTDTRAPSAALSERSPSPSLLDRLRRSQDALGISQAQVARAEALVAAGCELPAGRPSKRPIARLTEITGRLEALTDSITIAAVSPTAPSSSTTDLAGIVAEFQGLVAEVSKLARPAERVRTWRARQPKRGHKRTDWIWARQGVKYNGGMNGNDRAHLLARAKWFNKLRRAKGEHGGPLKAIGIEVYEALLFHYHNRKTGQCDPSLEEIAKFIRHSPSTVSEAIKRLAAAKLLHIVPRRDIGIRRDGRKLPCVVSNAYVFPRITENTRGTSVRARKFHPNDKDEAASPLSGDLRSPAATAQADRYGPPGIDTPF